jgi:hypothetical protein
MFTIQLNNVKSHLDDLGIDLSTSEGNNQLLQQLITILSNSKGSPSISWQYNPDTDTLDVQNEIIISSQILTLGDVNPDDFSIG